jgi:hypothetical protein
VIGEMSKETNKEEGKGGCPMGYDQPDSKWNIENKHDYEKEGKREFKLLNCWTS